MFILGFVCRLSEENCCILGIGFLSQPTALDHESYWKNHCFQDRIIYASYAEISVLSSNTDNTKSLRENLMREAWTTLLAPQCQGMDIV